MSGIVSLVYERDILDMGKKAESLLKNIPCPGSDSTGAAFIDAEKRIWLFKGLGGPERVCGDHPFDGQPAQRFIGFNRSSATCACTEVNCQPHRVECRSELVGAIHGSISNHQCLETWLLQRDHVVVSESQGEIIMHLVEDHFTTSAMLSSADLARMRQAYAYSGQRECMPDGVLRMIDAIRKADALIEGSYAAVMADPRLPGIFAVQSGEELLAARNADELGDYSIVVSDAASILKATDMPEPLPEGQGVWCTGKSFVTFNLRGAHAFPKLSASLAGGNQPL